MKKISIIIMVLVVALASCKKTPEVNLKYVDVERDLVTVGTTIANIQCDYAYIATLKKAYLYYGEGENEDNYTATEMRVVQKTLYVELTGLKRNTTYGYYYEFHNGFNAMRSALKSFKTETSSGDVTLPTVITAEVTEITSNSAKCGGEVTNDGGAEVTERGICWSTNTDPTLNDNHIATGSGMGAFTTMISDLEANTTYHVRAYAINEAGTAYGLDKEFETIEGGSCSCDYVDLGLPSGTLWSTCNIGANSPEEFGDYFAWGETEPKQIYTWDTYKWCNDDNSEQLTKYCNNPVYGFNGFVDNLISLEESDDAATVNWGDDWCIPTYEQWQELIDHTTAQWTTYNGVYGRLYTAFNGNSLFLPAAGFLDETSGNYIGTYGSYWTNWLNTLYPQNAWRFGFDRDNYSNQMNDLITYLRRWGLSIRPVRRSDSPNPPSDTPVGAINSLFSVSPTQKVYFSQGNLQYQASSNTWRFAENQWDFVGTHYAEGNFGTVYEYSIKCDNSLVSESYSGWIDLFGWGTSGWDNGNVYYHPYDSYTPQFDVEGPKELYGPPGDFDLIGVYSFSDWGVFNPISNGGNQSGLWRTLLEQEWEYLMMHRENAYEKHFSATVCNTIGCVILPDDWTCPLGVSYEIINYNWEENVFTQDEWDLMEQNGAAFFPVTCHRFADFSYYLCNCCYQTASRWTNDIGRNTVFIYNKGYGYVQNVGVLRCDAFSVRLVQDANPQNIAK